MLLERAGALHAIEIKTARATSSYLARGLRAIMQDTGAASATIIDQAPGTCEYQQFLRSNAKIASAAQVISDGIVVFENGKAVPLARIEVLEQQLGVLQKQISIRSYSKGIRPRCRIRASESDSRCSHKIRVESVIAAIGVQCSAVCWQSNSVYPAIFFNFI